MFNSEFRDRSNVLFVYLVCIAFAAMIGLSSCAQTPERSEAMTYEPPKFDYYFGGSIGSSETQPKDPKVFVGKVDEHDISGRVMFGVGIGDLLAFEASYADLGERDFDGTFTFMGVPTPDRGSIEAKGFTISALGKLPVRERFSLLGKVGAFFWDVEEEEIFGGVPESHSASGSDPMFGFGLQYDVFKRYGLRLEWERFMNVGDKNQTGEDDIDVIWGSIIYSFGR